MAVSLTQMLAPTTNQEAARQAARSVGALLRQTPTYTAFLGLVEAINADPTVQQLAGQMRAHQLALQMGRDPDEHAAALARVEAEIEALPVVREYRQAEATARRLFQVVDALISQEAGVAFAENAQRSGCGCGG
ncbi:MAG: YlbF family regulator [Anaerolineae bacterium]